MAVISDPLTVTPGRLAKALDYQRGHLFLWVPVCLAIGIGGYFALRFEPEAVELASIGAALLVCGAITVWVAADVRPIPVALALVLCGVLLAALRANFVAEPVLGFRYYGPIEGRVIAVDRSLSDKIRLTLDDVVLERMAPSRTPARVRVSLHGPIHFDAKPGLRVMMTGHLSPPQGPVEPGGFDFRRMAWFNKLGAVGYTRTPALVSAPVDPGATGRSLDPHHDAVGRRYEPGQTLGWLVADRQRCCRILASRGDQAALRPRCPTSVVASFVANLKVAFAMTSRWRAGMVRHRVGDRKDRAEDIGAQVSSQLRIDLCRARQQVCGRCTRGREAAEQCS